MSHFYLQGRQRWFYSLLVALGVCTQALSQVVTPAIYSNSGISGATPIQECNTVLSVTTCFGSVTNPGYATDGDFTTAATMNVPASALVTKTLKLRLDMDGLVPAGHRAGLMVSRAGGVLNLLGVNLVSAIKIRTYLSSNGGASQLQETKVVDASVAGALLGSSTGPMPLEFTAGQPFDQIEIEAASLVSLGYQLNVYYAYGLGVNTITTAKGYVSRFTTPTAANYSTAVVDAGITVCVNSNVSNPANAVDTDLTNNYATMGALVDLSCPTLLQTQLEGTAPAGYYAGFTLGSAGLLDASILSGLRLTTYLGSTVQESGSGAGLLNLSVLPGGKYNIRMAATKPFDRVELRRVSLLGALDNLRVYYGFGVEPRVFRDQTARISSFAGTENNYQVNGSLVCVNCAITGPELAVDQDLNNNYATVNTLLAVGGSTRLKMRLNSAGQAGNRAGVVMGLATGLIDAQLLTSIRVRTYGGTDGSQLRETIANSSLIGLELLADGRQEVAFRTTQDFEWVEVELTNGISALANARIYYAFADDAPSGFPSTITPPVSSPVTLASLRATNSDGAIDVNWQTTAEANSSHFIVERSLSATGSFQALGRVNAAGNSTTTRSYQYRDFDGISLNASFLFYRLRIVDLNGQETYSQTVSVSVRPPVVVFDLYPNPASSSEQVRMQLPDKHNVKYQMVIYNQLGTEVNRRTVSGARAWMAASDLAPGMYQVTLTDRTGRRLGSQRLVIRP